MFSSEREGYWPACWAWSAELSAWRQRVELNMTVGLPTRIEISGAGLSGLAAALVIAKEGRGAVVHEHNADVGGRFHGDFQGLENWTVDKDVLEELGDFGIAATFGHTPFREFVVFDPEGREFAFRSARPLFYLIRRGSQPETVDASLRDQAVAAGVEIRFNDPCHHLPNGGIIAEGPRGSDAIAVGQVFETDMADGAFGALSDDLAPKGYAYLLIHNGTGTIASCMFEDYHHEKDYLARTVEFFSRKVGMHINNARSFGGTGNFLASPLARKGGLLYAGEAAGFQDALWGFGMRYAMISGILAGQSFARGDLSEYDHQCHKRLGGLLQASIVNRYLFEKLGNSGYGALLSDVQKYSDAGDWLKDHYADAWWKSLLFPVARRAVRQSRKKAGCAVEGCDCTWCRCQHTTAGNSDMTQRLRKPRES